MTLRLRPPQEADLDALAAIDGGYGARFGVEPVVNAASLRYFARSGHAFVAERVAPDGTASCRGFVLAHAVWGGDRAAVQTSRLATAEAEESAVTAALLAALTKSAYDAGVYDLSVTLPRGDTALGDALAQATFQQDASVTFRRALGSRARNGGAATGPSSGGPSSSRSPTGPLPEGRHG